MKKRIVSIVILLSVVVVASMFYFLRKEHPIGSLDVVNITTTTLKTLELRHVPDGWREYQNTTYHFSLLYPRELEVNEYPEGEGASTITFQNAERGEGFQIFVLPYTEPQVSEERFRKDISSGVRTDLTTITIDGVVGAIFYSKDVFLGETLEVWFVRDGYLYEATTLKGLDDWFMPIMQTWNFI